MLVEPETIARLQTADPAARRLFVAGCAERMAQLFTGSRGAQEWRSHDVEVVITSLDSLWGSSPEGPYERLLSEVERFEEFEPSEEGVSDTVEIYAMYAALALRYALSCVTHDDADFAVKCGHILLTAMGQMDRNASSNLSEEERQFQARDNMDPAVFRRECQESAGKRLEVLLSRL